MHARLVVLGRKAQVLCNIYILFLNFLNVGNSKEKSRHSGVMNLALARWAWGSRPGPAQHHLRARDPLPQTSACLLCDRLRAGLLSVPRCRPDAPGASSHRHQHVSCVTVSGRASFPCPDVVQMHLGLPPTREFREPRKRRGVFAPVDAAFPVFPASGCSPFSFPVSFCPWIWFLEEASFSLWSVVEFCPLTKSLTKGPAMLLKSLLTVIICWVLSFLYRQCHL